jgi:hypothetical protein
MKTALIFLSRCSKAFHTSAIGFWIPSLDLGPFFRPAENSAEMQLDQTTTQLRLP